MWKIYPEEKVVSRSGGSKGNSMTRQRAMESIRSLKVAAWLGWQIESNWTDPFLFVVYSIVKPVAGALILVLMYTVIAQGGLQHPLFPQIFVGNAFYIYVAMVFIGVCQAVVEDREHYAYGDGVCSAGAMAGVLIAFFCAFLCRRPIRAVLLTHVSAAILCAPLPVRSWQQGLAIYAGLLIVCAIANIALFRRAVQRESTAPTDREHHEGDAHAHT